MLPNILSLIFGFVILWIGAGLIVNSVNHFSKALKISSFAFSFFILGILTSIPEFAVGVNAIAENKPDVFVGNLIGGIFVIFLLIIPLLAILGNGISLKNKLSHKNLLFSFFVMLTPAFLILDKKVNMLEAILMIALYCILFFLVQKDNGILNRDNAELMDLKNYSYKDLVKIIIGTLFAFVGSHFILEDTLYFAQLFNISPFLISLVFLSIGTNIPEFTLAIKSVLSGGKDVAFGDYVGSAAANTLLFGIFGLMYGTILINIDFLRVFVFLAMGLGLFYFFARSKDDISRKEGFMLLIFYILFLVLDLIKF